MAFFREHKNTKSPKKKIQKKHQLFKDCNLPCEFQHEGLCAVASITKGKAWPEDCKAKTEKDLVEVEDEFDYY